MITKKTAGSRRRLEPIEFAVRAATVVITGANVISFSGLMVLGSLRAGTDFINGVTPVVVLSTITAFPLTMLICWLNARQVQCLEQSHERFVLKPYRRPHRPL